MFLDSSTNLWTFWPDGEFYDFSREKCQDWEGSWAGYCAYQRSWFSCSPEEILDLDTLSWVSTWDSNTVEINNNNLLELESVWRSLNYYVDPSSEKLMELGTQEFPFRTIFTAFIEIMGQFSNSDSEITIYIRENTTVYIEDSSVFLLDLGLLTIDTYADSSTENNMATIVTTDSSTTKLSPKSAFNIVKNITVDIQIKIAEGAFTEEEAAIVGRGEDTFQLVRSPITINNIIARREAQSSITGVFIKAIYLQNKYIRIST